MLSAVIPPEHEANGAKVVREYYFNDHGEQINRFAKSLEIGRASCRERV